MKAKLSKNGCIDIIDYDAIVANINDNYQKRLTENSITNGVMSAISNKKEYELTDDDKRAVALRQQIDEQHETLLSQYSDYKDYVEEKYTGEEQPSDTDVLMPYFEETKTQIIRHLKLQKNEPWHVQQKIKSLKQELSESDYKIAKLYEAQLIGENAPYDATEIISQRQAWRKEINRLEELLNS